jgi:hypothetical protein
MAEAQERTPGPDDTAAFQRFYSSTPTPSSRSLLYRLFIGWWKDRP